MANKRILIFFFTVFTLYVSSEETSGSGEEQDNGSSTEGKVDSRTFGWGPQSGSTPPRQDSRTRSICKALETFVPNLCSNDEARKSCQDECQGTRGNRNALQCGKKDPLDATKKHRKKEKKKSKDKASKEEKSEKKEKLSKGKLSKRIVGGKESQQGEWPWMVHLHGHFDSTNPRKATVGCGGAILSERLILTAAHCTKNGATDPKKWKVWVGNHDADIYERKFETIHYVAKIFVHPDYKKNPSKKSDIAIFQLEKDIHLIDENKGRVCLPDDDLPIKEENQTCFVTGWGKTKWDGSYARILKHAEVQTVSRVDCNHSRPPSQAIDETELCAGTRVGGTDPCRGDSGGSMVCKMQKGHGYPPDERWYAGGIVSYGKKCGSKGLFQIYASVTYFKKWIVETILSRADEM